MILRLPYSAAIVAALFLAVSGSVNSAEPPEGFRPLFNGRDLEGWHGMPHFDPRDLAKMPEDARAKQIADWTEDARKHWTVENEELVNDGHGAYLATDA